MRTPIHYRSADGLLELYAEEGGKPDALHTVLCMHGLTRNSRDFGSLVAHLSTRHRVVTADQRGRGRSQWDANSSNYQPIIYAQDMFKLLDHLCIERAVLVGTSMGGIVAMTMAAMQQHRVRGIVLNDIGPEVPTEGLKRLRDSLIAPAQIATWQDAARQAQRVNGLAFPEFRDDDWLAFARRTYTEDASGRPVAAFDRAILNGLINADLSVVPANLWSLWAQLGAIPTLAIRGGLSDILSAETLLKMTAGHPRITTVTLANRGHAPMLDEPPAVAAIDTFLDGLE
jgi:pimeloyl-ACP methyl ester carboxylesterase